MTTPSIRKHWIVTGFNPPNEGDDETLGTVLGSTSMLTFATEEEAKTEARTRAAAEPGAVFMVFEAKWYAFTDITPVSILRVSSAPVT